MLTKLRSRIFRKQTIASYPKEQKNQKKNFKNVYRYLGLDSRKELANSCIILHPELASVKATHNQLNGWFESVLPQKMKRADG